MFESAAVMDGGVTAGNCDRGTPTFLRCLFRACVAKAVVVWLVGAKLVRPPSGAGLVLLGGELLRRRKVS